MQVEGTTSEAEVERLQRLLDNLIGAASDVLVFFEMGELKSRDLGLLYEALVAAGADPKNLELREVEWPE